MYFRIKRGSGLYEDFFNHIQKAHEATETAKEVIYSITKKDQTRCAVNQNFDSYVPYAILFEDEKPGPGWRRMEKVKGEWYMPDPKTKEGLEIQKKFDSIPKVPAYDYAGKFNHDGVLAPTKQGFLLQPEVHAINGIILVRINDMYHLKKRYEAPEDFEEILGSEYYRILEAQGVIKYAEEEKAE